MTEKGQEAFHRWLPSIIVFLSCLVTVAVAWGSFSARIAALEQQVRGGITRYEYDDLKDRMTRIENNSIRIEKKLDEDLDRRANGKIP